MTLEECCRDFVSYALSSRGGDRSTTSPVRASPILSPANFYQHLILIDIFTYIGIAYGNKWGLRASIYSSKDVFPSK
jgi:hypothetical protein